MGEIVLRGRCVRLAICDDRADGAGRASQEHPQRLSDHTGCVAVKATEDKELIMENPSQPRPMVLQCPQCGASLSANSAGYTVCQYCGSSLVLDRAGVEAGQPEGAVVRGMRFKEFTYTDLEGTGLPLFRVLVPSGWTSEGGCRWMLDNPGMPASVGFRFNNPEGAEMFEILPNMNFTWNNNPMTGLMFPVGSRYFGAEVRPLMSVQHALRELVLPRYRADVENLQILREEAQPDLPRLVRSEAAVTGGSAEGGKVRIRYTARGREYEEDIYGVVEAFRAPIPMMFGVVEVVFWVVDYLFSFRAAAKRLDATADIFKVMIGSFKLNPHWYAAYQSVVQYLAQQQIQRIHHIGQISQILAQTGREIREQNLSAWYARQDTYDRLATDRSRAIRGVDAFYDPHRQEVVELSSGYGHAWATSLGDYILTEDSGFDPNVHSNLNWEPMQPQ